MHPKGAWQDFLLLPAFSVETFINQPPKKLQPDKTSLALYGIAHASFQAEGAKWPA